MDPRLYKLIGIVAVIAPTLHVLTDIMEVTGNGFSRPQLIINYTAFLLIPFMIVGLYSVQHPRISWFGLAGAISYGISFIYFTHTTLLSLEEVIPDYESLWNRLGTAYTFHGVLMIVGGIVFGLSSLKTGMLWPEGLILFIAGLAVNLLIGLESLPDIFQTVGSTIRNIGLIGIGLKISFGQDPGTGESI